MSEPVRRSAAALTGYLAAIFGGIGTPDDVALEVAQHLVRASLSGHDSHGVLRAARYVRQADAGALDPRARPVVLRDRESAAVVDARRSFGIYSTGFALDWALERARTRGIAAAAVRHSTHIGRLGEYAERGASRGMIAIVTLGFAGRGLGGVIPFGGKRPFLSTNPWAFGFPSAGEAPMVFDAATSSIPEGKVMVALAKGVPVPPGTIVDKDGNPTTNPQDHYAGGALVPLGGALFGHKGFGLALCAAMMGGLAIVDDDDPTLPVGSSKKPERRGLMAGVFVLAIDPGLFGDADAYARQVAENLDALRGEEPAKGYEEIMAPGDPERRTRGARERDGIEVPLKTWNELVALGDRFGIAPP